MWSKLHPMIYYKFYTSQLQYQGQKNSKIYSKILFRVFELKWISSSYIFNKYWSDISQFNLCTRKSWSIYFVSLINFSNYKQVLFYGLQIMREFFIICGNIDGEEKFIPCLFWISRGGTITIWSRILFKQWFHSIIIIFYPECATT
jgi:hypothetical protein